MGLLQNGKWVDKWYDTKKTNGKFVRKSSQFRNWITVDGDYKPQADRYHLYVSLACPWAHRTLIFRMLKGLEDMISVSTVHWYMAENGWTFDITEAAEGDKINNKTYMYEIYTKADPEYSGRVTVPVLWDKQTDTIVSNESSEIIRMFNSEFDKIGAKSGDYYPQELRLEIDMLNQRIYDTVNNGVYKAGFATTQVAYEEAVVELFETLDWLEKRLGKTRYLIGDTLTEADWRLFTTLVRFDAVYVGHFKCNIRRIEDYDNLSRYLCDLYQYSGIAETVNMDHIKNHYYVSHKTINPSGTVPLGPELHLDRML